MEESRDLCEMDHIQSNKKTGNQSSSNENNSKLANSIRFDDLPDELILMVFEYLNMNELITKCRLVNKKFKLFAEQVKFSEIIVVDSLYGTRYLNSWLHSYKPINPNKTICTNVLDLNFILSDRSPFRNNFTYLKHLKFNLIGTAYFFNFLNRMIKLEHLELGTIRLRKDEKLCLPNLKVLEIEIYDGRNEQNDSDEDSSDNDEDRMQLDGYKLTIDAQNLNVLFCEKLNSIQLIYPSSVKHLEVRRYNSNIDQFNKLESLKCEKISNTNPNILKCLPKLKRLHLFDYFLFESRFKFSKIIEFYKNIIDKKRFLGKFDLELFLNGVQFLDGKRFEDNMINGLNFDTQILHFKNYKYLADTIPDLSEFNYTWLLNLYEEIPEDFPIKFNNIQSIIVRDKLDDQDQFVSFLKRCPNLCILNFSNSNLNQTFYDQLSDITCSFTHLLLRDKKEFKIEFDSIKHFKLLSFLIISKHQSIDFIEKCFKKFKLLEQIYFLNGGNTFHIKKKYHDDLYTLSFDNGDRLTKLGGIRNELKQIKHQVDFDELIETCQKLDKKSVRIKFKKRRILE